MALRVLHLVGSAVSDFYADLSRLYAQDCLEATADPSAYDVRLAWVTPDGRWRFPFDLSRAAIAAAPPVPLEGAVQVLAGMRVDVAVPQMFCIPGLTTYRSLLDLLGIPYLGNAAATMALTVNKARAKAVVAAAGVAVPAGQVLLAGQAPSLALPVVVKPVDADNSLGVSLVRAADELGPALAHALDHGPVALVESYVELGREVRCGVLERDGQLVALPLEEYAVDTATKPVRDHEDKIRRSADGELALVAKDRVHAWIVDPADPLTAVVQEAARACHTALGCRHYSLFDFRVDPSGTPWFLEAGLYCSFARQSVVSVMAAAAGTSTRRLFADALRQVAPAPAARVLAAS